MNLEKAIRLPGEKHRLSLPLLLLGLVAVGGVAQADDSGNLQERLLACEGIVSQEQKLEDARCSRDQPVSAKFKDPEVD